MVEYNRKVKKASFDELFDLYQMKKEIIAKLSFKTEEGMNFED